MNTTHTTTTPEVTPMTDDQSALLAVAANRALELARRRQYDSPGRVWMVCAAWEHVQQAIVSAMIEEAVWLDNPGIDKSLDIEITEDLSSAMAVLQVKARLPVIRSAD